MRAAITELLGRVVGPVPDLEVRADAGPALIVMQLVTRGRPPDESEIRSVILPVMLEGTRAS